MGGNKKAFQSNANRSLADSSGQMVNKFEHVDLGILCSEAQVEEIWTWPVGPLKSQEVWDGGGRQVKMFKKVQVLITWEAPHPDGQTDRHD